MTAWLMQRQQQPQQQQWKKQQQQQQQQRDRVANAINNNFLMSSTCEETRASQLPQGNTLSSSSGINTPHPSGQNTPLLQPQHLFLLLLFYSAAWIGCNCFDCSWWRGLHTRSTLCSSLSLALSLSPSNPHALELSISLFLSLLLFCNIFNCSFANVETA